MPEDRSGAAGEPRQRAAEVGARRGNHLGVEVRRIPSPAPSHRPGRRLWSRNGSNLSSHFPDLVAAAEAQLAAGVVLDGEAVVWLDGRLNFDQLQRRMVSRPAVAAKLAREHPASYVAFDLLTLGEQDLRPHPWRDRRAALEDLASTGGRRCSYPPTPTTTTPALEWLVDYRVAGVEGLVAKGAGSPTVPAAETGSK